MNIILKEMVDYFIVYYNFIEPEESHLQTKVIIITRSIIAIRVFYSFTKFSFLKTYK